jgi:hypothetical protein
MLNCIIFLGIVIFIYYKVNSYMPINTKYHYYLGGFVFIVLFFMYLMNYQKSFVYKVARNIKNSNNIQAHELLPDYTYKNNSDTILKSYLLDKQSFKCYFCNRDIDINYLNYYNYNYISPLEYGGSHTIDNLCLSCPSCS